ncbi:MAG: hypothetical protein Q7U34_01890 [Anaerolineales bacterium]|nr:hypothetical protein [Anaerolineales bacterium]
MEQNAIIETPETDNTWKVKTLLIGAALGALTGLGAAYLLTKRAEQHGKPLAITSGQGVKLGMLLAGLIRQILRIGEE